MMKKSTTWILVVLSILLLSSCGKFEDIAIHGMKDVKFRGMSNGRILLNITLDIENPNNRKITISKIEFKAWLNNRELGKLKNSKKIVLKSKSREEIEIPVEIVLRTAADAFKLMTLKGDILEQLTVEGFIKGRTMCISKKIKIEKQPFAQLAKSFKGKIEQKDSLQTKDEILQNDTLKAE
jgi:LEA14-like dessication related protein